MRMKLGSVIQLFSSYRIELDHFLSAIRGETPLSVTVKGNYLAQKLVDDTLALSSNRSDGVNTPYGMNNLLRPHE
jgi:hypothetical protein